MKTNTLFILLPTHLPPPSSALPSLSPSTSCQRCGEKDAHGFPSLSSLTLFSRRGAHPLFFYPFSHTSFSSPPPLSFSLSLLLLAVALMASICHCYIQDCLLHESRWEWGTDGGVEVGVRGGLKKIDYRNESESVLSIHSL